MFNRTKRITEKGTASSESVPFFHELFSFLYNTGDHVEEYAEESDDDF